MEVEGIHLASDDTVSGIAKHKRVDAPTHLPRSDLADKNYRSLTLESQSLELRAILDRVEIDDQGAKPIEYRKGRPRAEIDEDGREVLSPWPTDRVQVGLQSVLLEEAGYKVHEAELYYFETNQKITIEITSELKVEALTTLESAKKAAQGARPLPLVADPKCPKCSLYAICLPDEIQQSHNNSPRTSLTNEDLRETGERLKRKIWPACDEGNHVIVQTHGCRIGVNGHCLKSLRVTERS